MYISQLIILYLVHLMSVRWLDRDMEDQNRSGDIPIMTDNLTHKHTLSKHKMTDKLTKVRFLFT